MSSKGLLSPFVRNTCVSPLDSSRLDKPDQGSGLVAVKKKETRREDVVRTCDALLSTYVGHASQSPDAQMAILGP